MVDGATTIPGAALDVIVSWYPPVAGHVVPGIIDMNLTIDPPLSADAAARYALGTLEFHHQNSVAGPSSSKCGDATQPHCFMIVHANATIGGVQVNLTPETVMLGWHIDPVSAPVQCAYTATPARAQTWGSIKTIYR